MIRMFNSPKLTLINYPTNSVGYYLSRSQRQLINKEGLNMSSCCGVCGGQDAEEVKKQEQAEEANQQEQTEQQEQE